MNLQIIFQHWTLVRWLRLAMGLFAGFQAWSTHDGLVGMVAALLLGQALFNFGCCSGGACAVPSSKQMTKQEELKKESTESV